ncbi:MAG TPA: hypothetical protein VJU53_07470, partial [Burkholderiaceae bacterium]|nr:hypothetical protein [Burkholderiaceae bacterium]
QRNIAVQRARAARKGEINQAKHGISKTWAVAYGMTRPLPLYRAYARPLRRERAKLMFAVRLARTSNPAIEAPGTTDG